MDYETPTVVIEACRTITRKNVLKNYNEKIKATVKTKEDEKNA